MSDATLASLTARFDAIEDDTREIKALLREHAAEMKTVTTELGRQAMDQEVRLSVVERQLEDSRARGRRLAEDVEANKLSLAKASVIAIAAALVIPVVAELIGNQLIQQQHSHELSRNA